MLALALQVVRPGLTHTDRARLGQLIEGALHEPPRPPWPGRGLPDRLGVRSLIVPRDFAGMLDAPGDRRAAYSARLEGRFLLLSNLSTGSVTRVRAPSMSNDDRVLLTDVTVDLNASLRIIRWHTPNQISWVAQDVTVIQNGPATHALVLSPADGFVDGSYRLTLTMTRRWIDTVDPVGPDNAYSDESTIEFEVVG